MSAKEDEFNLDGTVDVALNCKMKMSRLDYMIMVSLYRMTEEEKEQLLLKSIPRITARRIIPTKTESIGLKKHQYRLNNLKVFVE